MTITIKSNPDGVSGAIQVNGVDAFAFGNGAQFSFRNKIINGAFGINQRAYVSGAATTANQYTLDRWKVTGTGGITFSTANNKTTVTIPAGQTLQQVIEGLNLATGTYVLSWEGTAQGRIDGGSYGASGTVTASITGGANTTIEFNTGTVANVQLEAGSSATPFEHRPYGVELAMCQRYYQTKLIWVGKFTGTGTVAVYGQFVVPMRTAPSITIVDGTNGLDEMNIASRNISSINSVGVGTVGGNIGISVSTAGTTNNMAGTTPSATFAISAEL